MDIKVNVKIEGLDQLTESLALIGSALAYKNNMVKTSSEAVDLMLDVTDKIEDLTDEEKVKKEVVEEVVKEVVQAPDVSKEDVKEEETKENKITREQVREAFVSKNSPSTRDQLKSLLEKYKAPNITELAEEHFQSILKDLEAI